MNQVFKLGVFMAAASSLSCNLSGFAPYFQKLYNQHFQYSLPESNLKAYLSGVAFDRKTPYTEDELGRLAKDLDAIFQHTMKKVQRSSSKPLALITAGAPGAGKTVLLEENKGDLPYVDPDAVSLKNMHSTFHLDLANGMKGIGTLEEERVLRQKIYNDWRPASNAIAQICLGHLVAEKSDLAYGMTSTSPHTKTFFEFLKKNGYEIRLLHVSAPDEVRVDSVKARDKEFVQTTEEDIKEKGKLFFDRLPDYFQYTDEVAFYWREKTTESACKAAVWKKGEKIEVFHQGAFEKIQQLHDQMEKEEHLKWENVVKKYG